MTLPIDKSTRRGALLSAAREYPGGIRQLAADMDMPESTLYAKLRGEKGYPIGFEDEIDDVLGFLRSRDVTGWDRCIHIFCHAHDHLAIPIPRALKDGSTEGLRQVSQMLQEVAVIAREMSDSLDQNKADGQLINSKEMKRVEAACDEAMEKIAETREWCRVQHRAAKSKGLVK